MSIDKQYKIGTRGSLLAVTQCTLAKNILAKKSGEQFELVKISTQGDQQTDKPLWQLDGKDFFTKELDSALLTKEVDFVIHSYKDLGSERPEGIKLAAISKRVYAHDILLIKKSTIKELAQKNIFTVGTSSPRRTQNLGSSLLEFLPDISANASLKIKNLRGNVNTRIEKLRTGEYDAIILAFAGLERLASYPQSQVILSDLLSDLNFMVLPQKFFPSAASQGALGIECLESADEKLNNVLSHIHDETTSLEMQRERKHFASFGGGCHLAVGIYVKKVKDYFLHYLKGEHGKQTINKTMLEGFDYSPFKRKTIYFVFKEFDFLIKKTQIDTDVPAENLFVTSTHCLHNIPEHSSSLWSAGTRTMKQMIKKGFWVNGSSEGLGHQELIKYQESKALALMLENSRWKVLSHNNSNSILGDTLSCYQHEVQTNYEAQLLEQMLKSDIVYWSSKIQYKTYTEKFPELKTKHHACGLGKTYDFFQEEKIPVIPCIDMTQLKNTIMESK